MAVFNIWMCNVHRHNQTKHDSLTCFTLYLRTILLCDELSYTRFFLYTQCRQALGYRAAIFRFFCAHKLVIGYQEAIQFGESEIVA